MPYDHIKRFTYHKDSSFSLTPVDAKSACAAWGKNFYRLKRWRKIRSIALKTYGDCCHSCGERHTKENPIHVDHIKSRAIFPELAFDLNNTQILCSSCNSKKGHLVFTDFRPNNHKMLMEAVVGRYHRNVQQPTPKRLKHGQRVKRCISKLTRVVGRNEYEYNLNRDNTIAALKSNHGTDVLEEALKECGELKWAGDNVQVRLSPRRKEIKKDSVTAITYKKKRSR